MHRRRWRAGMRRATRNSSTPSSGGISTYSTVASNDRSTAASSSWLIASAGARGCQCPVADPDRLARHASPRDVDQRSRRRTTTPMARSSGAGNPQHRERRFGRDRSTKCRPATRRPCRTSPTRIRPPSRSARSTAPRSNTRGSGSNRPTAKERRGCDRSQTRRTKLARRVR